MTLEDDAKFNGKLTRGMKNDNRNLVNFNAGSQMPENLYFDGLILSKAYEALDEKAHNSCLMTLKTDSWFQKWH